MQPLSTICPVPLALIIELEKNNPLREVPVPHEVPLNVSEPELVVTLLELTSMPRASFVPFAAMPEIVTLPAPVADKLADELRKTPFELSAVPQEVPLTVSEPELVVTLDEFTRMPLALVVPFATVPVIVTLPASVAEMLEYDFR